MQFKFKFENNYPNSNIPGHQRRTSLNFMQNINSIMSSKKNSKTVQLLNLTLISYHTALAQVIRTKQDFVFARKFPVTRKFAKLPK